MFVKTRQEMAQFLNDRMNKTYRELSEGQRLEVDSSLAKTYLVEAHLLGKVSHDQTLTFIKANFTQAVLGKTMSIKIRETDEDNFFLVELERDKQLVILYIDATDSRFWIIHSMNKSIVIDRLIDRLTVRCQDLDRAWLPIQLLEATAELGSLRGLGLHYDRRHIPDTDFDAPAAPVEFLKMQLWGDKAGRVLQILRQEQCFPHATTLSKVKVKCRLDGQNNWEFSIDDVKYDGKITARGTSFQSHITLVSNLYRRYSNKTRMLEQKYAISYEEKGKGFSIRGMPINILFCEPIKNLDAFCKSVFSSTAPFLLWGVPIRLSDRYIRISGFDLHLGRRVDFEITPQFMRIYLPSGSCGSSVVRIFTNLQHYYDSLIKAEDANGESIFEF